MKRPLLIIPALEISRGKCVFGARNQFAETELGTNPVQIAQLWRLMNARSIWIFDRDAEYEIGSPDLDTVTRICSSLDIPVLVGGGVHSVETVEMLLDAGAYRVAIDFSKTKDLSILRESAEAFSSSRICAVIHIRNGFPQIDEKPVSFEQLADMLPDTQCTRLVCTLHDQSTDSAIFDAEFFDRMASLLKKLRITITGGITGYDDLKHLLDLPPNVDSVIIGRALYEEKFPCQAMWCWHNLESLDLSKRSTARLRG